MTFHKTEIHQTQNRVFKTIFQTAFSPLQSYLHSTTILLPLQKNVKSHVAVSCQKKVKINFLQLFATWISTTAKLSRLNWNTQQANFLFAHSKYNCNVCEFASRSTKILIKRHFSSYFEKQNFLISISIFIFQNAKKNARHMHNFCQKFKAKRKCF